MGGRRIWMDEPGVMAPGVENGYREPGAKSRVPRSTPAPRWPHRAGVAVGSPLRFRLGPRQVHDPHHLPLGLARRARLQRRPWRHGAADWTRCVRPGVLMSFSRSRGGCGHAVGVGPGRPCSACTLAPTHASSFHHRNWHYVIAT